MPKMRPDNSEQMTWFCVVFVFIFDIYLLLSTIAIEYFEKLQCVTRLIIDEIVCLCVFSDRRRRKKQFTCYRNTFDDMYTSTFDFDRIVRISFWLNEEEKKKKKLVGTGPLFSIFESHSSFR